MKLDSYVQFKMSFDGFYSFLDQIASTVNNLSSSVENVSNTWISQESSAATKWVDDNIQGNLKDIDINVTPTFNLDLDLDFL
ncbi:TPA: hypothetical protein DEP21_05730 [Patescibacteria group bacterium]|nr:hypothetical protein [Candidatus Gracilibacteria bacterium]